MADYEEAERAMWAGLRVLESHLATVRTNLNRLVRTTASEMGELKEELRTAWEEVNLERKARHDRESEPTSPAEPEPVKHEIQVTHELTMGETIKVRFACHACPFAVTVVQTGGQVQDTIDAIVESHEQDPDRDNGDGPG